MTFVPGDGDWSVVLGDSRSNLKNVADATFDSVVTDAPYEFGFMGQAWDGTGVSFEVEFWKQVFRVLKPGGHALVFGGTRTFHRIACAIEDAGFEIRDSIDWLYGQGMPKSLDVSKAIDKAAGATREVIGTRTLTGSAALTTAEKGGTYAAGTSSAGKSVVVPVTAPATEAAKRWDGWGTALKPNHEPIIVARKPFTGTVAANVLAHGTGALNVGGCRVETAGSDAGRWPPNVVLTHSAGCRRAGRKRVRGNVCGSDDDAQGRFWSEDGGWKHRVPSDHADAEGRELVDEFSCEPDCPVRTIGEQSGDRPSAGNKTDTTGKGAFFGSTGRRAHAVASVNKGDRGTAARYYPTFEWHPEVDDVAVFYCPKASRAEREAGCDSISPNPKTGRRNDHSTVKPVALMRWLCRLVTPPGGVVFDPFAGAGTTGIAALSEGFRFVGFELVPRHAAIARARIAYWAGRRAA